MKTGRTEKMESSGQEQSGMAMMKGSMTEKMESGGHEQSGTAMMKGTEKMESGGREQSGEQSGMCSATEYERAWTSR